MRHSRVQSTASTQLPPSCSLRQVCVCVCVSVCLCGMEDREHIPTQRTDPQREIVDVTVNGLLNVLRSCEKAALAGTFKRFVHCSSMAAIQDLSRPADYVFTEDDNNLSATVQSDPYSCSKYLADVACTKFVDEEQKGKTPEERFTCALINPGAIYGPILASHHATASPVIVHDLMTGGATMMRECRDAFACTCSHLALTHAHNTLHNHRQVPHDPEPLVSCCGRA
jgi:hypothetical protein